MNKTFILCFAIIVCVGGWVIGGKLSNDTLSMMLGVIFGMMAGIPAILIALGRNRSAIVHHHHTHTVDRIVEHPVKVTERPQLPQPQQWRVVPARQIEEKSTLAR